MRRTNLDTDARITSGLLLRRRTTAAGRALARLLVVLLALPVGELRSAPQQGGTISGVVRLDGNPKSGVTVAFIELQSGTVVRATSGDNGGFETQAPVGEYAVTTESQAGLAVKQAPLRVAVVEGKVASADLELTAVPSAVLEPPAAAAPTAPSAPADTTPAPETAAPPAAETAAALSTETPPAAALPGEFAETTGAGAAIQFKPVTCFVAGEFPLLDAGIEPAASVARARVYFKGAGGSFYYYVEMSQDVGRYFGKLPRPQVTASPITYYLQATTTDFEESQTREIEAAVVERKEDCEGRVMAAFGPPGPVTVFSAATGAVGTPGGFAAAAASSILAGVIAIIAGSAAAAGVVGGIVTPPVQGATPPPAALEPTPIPTPEPIVVATPTPITTFR